MKRFNIVVPKPYKDKNGDEKTAWNNVGTLVKFDATQERPEGYILELNMYPNTTFKVFEQKPREDRPQQRSSQDFGPEDIGRDMNSSEVIDPDDIPF